MHQLNADLGEPIRINREPRGEIVVDSFGIDGTVNGSDVDKTGWILDGSSIVEVQVGGTEVQPSVDAIQEFKERAVVTF